MNNQQLVAVYGTLRAGEGNNGTLECAGSEYKGTCTLDNFVMHSLHGGFPGVFQGEGKVLVEVYSVDDLTPLDCLEGYDENAPKDGLYDRCTTPTPFGEALIYTYNGERFGDVITDWCEWQMNQAVNY